MNSLLEFIFPFNPIVTDMLVGVISISTEEEVDQEAPSADANDGISVFFG